MIVGRLLNKVINIFTGIFAIATIILMLVAYINAVFPFLPADAMTTVERFRNYFTLATVFCAGIEFTLKRNVIFAAVFAAIVVAVLAFMLYTDFNIAAVPSAPAE